MKISILKELEWFEWFGPSPIEPFNSGYDGWKLVAPFSANFIAETRAGSRKCASSHSHPLPYSIQISHSIAFDSNSIYNERHRVQSYTSVLSCCLSLVDSCRDKWASKLSSAPFLKWLKNRAIWCLHLAFWKKAEIHLIVIYLNVRRLLIQLMTELVRQLDNVFSTPQLQ